MKKKILIIAGIIVLAAAAFLGFKLFSKKKVEYTFDTVKVEKGSITNTVTATGTIQAIKTISVGTQVSGLIDKIYVDFNDVVKKGQVLAKLDTTALRAQYDQSMSQVDQAQAQLSYQKATYDRLKGLYDKNLIAQADFDQAEYNYKNAVASLNNAKSALDRAKVNLGYATIYSPIDGVVLNRAIELGQTVAASFSTPTLFSIANDLTQMQVQTSVDEADIGKVKNNQRVEFTVDAYPDLKFKGSVSQVRLQPTTTNNVVTYTVILNAPNPDKKLMPGMTASATIFVQEKDSTLVLSGKALRFTPSTAYLQEMRTEMRKMMASRNGGSGGAMASPAGAQSGFQGGAMRSGSAASGQPTGTGTGMQGGAGQGFGGMRGQLPADEKMVWVKGDQGRIHPARIKIGIDNGTNVEVLSGLKEGEEVVVSMSGAKAATTTSTTSNRPRGPFPF
jgi:HlyD family secretion protein